MVLCSICKLEDTPVLYKMPCGHPCHPDCLSALFRTYTTILIECEHTLRPLIAKCPECSATIANYDLDQSNFEVSHAITNRYAPIASEASLNQNLPRINQILNIQNYRNNLEHFILLQEIKKQRLHEDSIKFESQMDSALYFLRTPEENEEHRRKFNLRPFQYSPKYLAKILADGRVRFQMCPSSNLYRQSTKQIRAGPLDKYLVKKPKQDASEDVVIFQLRNAYPFLLLPPEMEKQLCLTYGELRRELDEKLSESELSEPYKFRVSSFEFEDHSHLWYLNSDNTCIEQQRPLTLEQTNRAILADLDKLQEEVAEEHKIIYRESNAQLIEMKQLNEIAESSIKVATRMMDEIKSYFESSSDNREQLNDRTSGSKLALCEEIEDHYAQPKQILNDCKQGGQKCFKVLWSDSIVTINNEYDCNLLIPDLVKEWRNPREKKKRKSMRRPRIVLG